MAVSRVTLLAWVHRLPPAHVRALSRIVIEPGPGRSRVVGSIAAHEADVPVGLHGPDLAERPILRRPVAADDVEGRALQSPPIKRSGFSRVPDAVGWIDSRNLPGQYAELEQSGIVGALNIERLGETKTVISTHAGTQAERDAWLIGLTAARRG